jgi:hypothetical protein
MNYGALERKIEFGNFAMAFAKGGWIDRMINDYVQGW